MSAAEAHRTPRAKPPRAPAGERNRPTHRIKTCHPGHTISGTGPQGQARINTDGGENNAGAPLSTRSVAARPGSGTARPGRGPQNPDRARNTADGHALALAATPRRPPQNGACPRLHAPVTTRSHAPSPQGAVSKSSPTTGDPHLASNAQIQARRPISGHHQQRREAPRRPPQQGAEPSGDRQI